MKLILTAILVMFSFNTFAGSTCTQDKISGVYKGGIVGGGDWGETAFYLDPDGGLRGIYFMHFADTKTGFLYDLVLDAGTVSGLWKDEFGTGSIEFAFADDCASFNGLWNRASGWNGVKTVK